jgi:hypothetical protein
MFERRVKPLYTAGIRTLRLSSPSQCDFQTASTVTKIHLTGQDFVEK